MENNVLCKVCVKVFMKKLEDSHNGVVSKPVSVKEQKVSKVVLSTCLFAWNAILSSGRRQPTACNACLSQSFEVSVLPICLAVVWSIGLVHEPHKAVLGSMLMAF